MSLPKLTAEQSLMAPNSHFRATAASAQGLGVQPMVGPTTAQRLGCWAGCAGLNAATCLAQCVGELDLSLSCWARCAGPGWLTCVQHYCP